MTGLAAGPGSNPGMVRIPAGSYVPLYAAPNARVAVAAFSIDRYAVNEKALRGTGSASAPATNVNLKQARNYCMAQGKRLPTEDEWEYVAGASETLKDARRDAGFRQMLLELYTRPHTQPRIGSGFRNAFGVWDLHGVVWEWVEMPKHHHGQHDMGCAASAIGAGDTSDFAAFLRYTFRNGLTESSAGPNLGFRCASS